MKVPALLKVWLKLPLAFTPESQLPVEVVEWLLFPVHVHVTVPPTATVTLNCEKKLSPMLTDADDGGGGAVVVEEGTVVVVGGAVEVVAGAGVVVVVGGRVVGGIVKDEEVVGGASVVVVVGVWLVVVEVGVEEVVDVAAASSPFDSACVDDEPLDAVVDVPSGSTLRPVSVVEVNPDPEPTQLVATTALNANTATSIRV